MEESSWCYTWGQLWIWACFRLRGHNLGTSVPPLLYGENKGTKCWFWRFFSAIICFPYISLSAQKNWYTKFSFFGVPHTFYFGAKKLVHQKKIAATIFCWFQWATIHSATNIIKIGAEIFFWCTNLFRCWGHLAGGPLGLQSNCYHF